MNSSADPGGHPAGDLLDIEVACAFPQRQRVIALSVPHGTTIEEAITLSGLLEAFPELSISSGNVGVFGQRRALADPVGAGDRVEIYRPLELDPKEARRLRAQAGT